MKPKKQPLILNLAASCRGTRALGPGLRSVVWVQGCPFHCPGCIAPQWIPNRQAHQVTPEELLPALLADPRIRGLTFSGGEPFLQSAALTHLARVARQERDLDIICFTGYLLEDLQRFPNRSWVHALLAEVDVLIDGPYRQEENDNRGLRGSANQVVHHLTDRLADTDFLNQPRRAEIHVQDGAVWVVGIPPVGMETQLNQTIQKAVKDVWSQASHHLHS